MSNMIKVLFSIIFTLLIFIESTEGCFAFGGCGLGLGLFMNPYSLRYCNARAKAKSSNTFKEDDDKIVDEEKNYLEDGYSKDIPNKLSTSPDDKFLECCQNRGLSKTCQNICSYTNYTKKTLQEMYFNVNGCPLSEISNIHFCASGGKDHKSCCINKGVSLTSSGDRCLIFCDTEPAIPMQLDLSYVSCYDKFDQMKECFLEETNTKSWNNFDVKNQDIQYDSNDENYKRFKTNTGGSSWF